MRHVLIIVAATLLVVADLLSADGVCSCSCNRRQPLSRSKAAAYEKPDIFVYAKRVSYRGSGRLLVEAQDSVLLEFVPPAPLSINLPETLELRFRLPEGKTDASAGDFSFWKNGWTINGGRNSIPFGRSRVNIKYPIQVVLEDGHIYLSVRNFGKTSLVIEDISLAMNVVLENGKRRQFGY